jgi:hypothetical protein
MMSPLVVIDDFDPLCKPILPDKAEAPLVVDPNAVLPRATPARRLEPVPRRSGQVPQLLCRMELPQLPLRRTLNIRRKPPSELAAEESLSLAVGE